MSDRHVGPLFQAALAAATFATALPAAATVHTLCDVWNHRSRVLLEADGLTGSQYQVRIISTQRHVADSPDQAPVDGQVQFVFDSDEEQIAEGATRIFKHFIVHDKVYYLLTDVDTGLVIYNVVHRCRDLDE